MEKYQKVQKPRPQTPFNENEMKITSLGLLGNYVNHATSLFQERRGREIVLKGMGQAINKTVTIAEILKRRIPQLHQDTAIDSVSVVDVWEPTEEGLVPVQTSRRVSAISITLSTEELNKNSPGYQAPAFVEQPRPPQNYQQRSQQQTRQARTGNNVVSEDAYGHGRVPGRGRGRGLYRGGYRNYEGGYRGNYHGGHPGNHHGGYQGNYRGGYQGNYPGDYQGNHHGGYQGNYRGGYQGNYPGGYQGNYPGSYQGNYQENGGYLNRSQGGARGPRAGGYSNRGTGYGRGRGRGGGRGSQY